MTKLKRYGSLLGKRLREGFERLTADISAIGAFMNKDKVDKIVDTTLIVGFVGVAGSQLLEWFPQYELVVLFAILVATLRLVR